MRRYDVGKENDGGIYDVNLPIQRQVHGTKRLSGDKFYAYYLFQREGQSAVLFRADRLFQEHCALMFAKSENQRLFYQRQKQGQFVLICTTTYLI